MQPNLLHADFFTLVPPRLRMTVKRHQTHQGCNQDSKTLGLWGALHTKQLPVSRQMNRLGIAVIVADRHCLAQLIVAQAME
jgi:hypothetical protein